MIRFLQIKIALLIFSTVLSISQNGFSQENGYYVLNEKNEVIYQNSDITKVKPICWIIRLYSKNKPKGGNDNWGLIIDGTYDGALSQLRSSKALQSSIENILSLQYKNNYCYDNTLGPIAILKVPSTNLYYTIISSIHSVSDKYKKLKSYYYEIKKLIKEKYASQNLPIELENAYKEFAKSLEDLDHSNFEVQNKAFKSNDIAIINSQIAEIKNKLSRSESDKTGLEKINKSLSSSISDNEPSNSSNKIPECNLTKWDDNYSIVSSGGGGEEKYNVQLELSNNALNGYYYYESIISREKENKIFSIPLDDIHPIRLTVPLGYTFSQNWKFQDGVERGSIFIQTKTTPIVKEYSGYEYTGKYYQGKANHHSIDAFYLDLKKLENFYKCLIYYKVVDVEYINHNNK